MTDRGQTDALRRALRLSALIVLPFGMFWAAVGLAIGARPLAAQGLIGVALALWLVFEARTGSERTEGWLATRIALGAQIAALGTVVVEPVVGVAIALSSLLPILLALPYVGRRSLTLLMVASASVGAFALTAPVALPWGTRDATPISLILPTIALVLVYVLFLLFLRNASTRLTERTSELRHVIEMSHDLAATLDPKDVGHRLARHIALVTHADECVLSTWDRDGQRVVTFGTYPQEHGPALAPAYDLADYPATQRVLVDKRTYVVDVDNPEADPAEVDYLRSIGHRTLVMFPLVVRGESIGIVELSSTRRDAFADREIELARLLVREAAVTFDNARLYDELRQVAYLDSLTGLANRARLQDRVDHALERLRGRSANHVAVLFIDLDHFKNLNDQFGHAKGDLALRVLAQRIQAIVRPGDTVARLGGDEFAVLLEDVESPEAVGVVCSRLLDALSEPVELDVAAPIVGASIGYAMSGQESSTSEALLRNADIAMYAAKAGGRGQIVAFRPDLLETASARSELASLLRGAASRHELQLAFQPLVTLEQGTPVGVEALVRWQPAGHLVHLPAEFLELAEETGEILPIGHWVIGEGCRRARAWQERHKLPNLRLYVNLSARQFHDPGLVPMILDALHETGFAADNLTLEITEGTLTSPGYDTVERIDELRALGLRMAIDDFGTGFSSLGTLHAFQIDELKIDRSFVPGSGAIGDAHVLSQAIVELGRALSLDMIAEGIETQAQADWFQALGCRLGQGYLFAHPMAAAELDRYLRRQMAAPADVPPRDGTAARVGPGRTGIGGITDVLGGRKVAADGRG